jgi:hypothetical protein
MPPKIIIALLGLLLVLGGWFAYSYFSDKEVIKRQLFGLAAEVSKERQEPTVKMALKMGTIKNMVAKSCTVIIPEKGYDEALEQDLIIQYLIYYRDRFTLLIVTLEDMLVDIPAKGRAEAQVTVSLQRQYSPQTEPIKEVHQVRLTLVKSEKKWLIQKATLPQAVLD